MAVQEIDRHSLLIAQSLHVDQGFHLQTLERTEAQEKNLRAESKLGSSGLPVAPK